MAKQRFQNVASNLETGVFKLEIEKLTFAFSACFGLAVIQVTLISLNVCMIISSAFFASWPFLKIIIIYNQSVSYQWDDKFLEPGYVPYPRNPRVKY